MDILRGNTVIASVHPTDDSVYACKLMGDNALKLNFHIVAAVDLSIGDHIVYNGDTFTLNSNPTVKEVSTHDYEYNCEFQAVDFELQKVEYRLFDNTPVPPQGTFSLMGNARTFVQLIVDNMNRVQSGWTLGDVLDTEFTSIDFSEEDCYTVLQNLAKQFYTEFYFTGKCVNLQQKPFSGTVIQLEYGKGKGMKWLQKLKSDNSSNLITSLYVTGGTRNLPSGYRGGATALMIPSGLPLQSNVNLYGVREGSLQFGSIYPRLAAGTGTDPGTVTAASGLYQFTDSHLDFDVNQYLTSSSAKVVFLTGQLNGYQFEIAHFDYTTKTFTLNAAAYENSIILPSDNFKAAPGDTYVLIDITMPQAYVDRAEAELLAAATAYLPTCSNPLDNYTGDNDPIYFKQNNISIALGQVIRIVSSQLGINKEKRVIGYNQNLNIPSNYKLEFGEVITGKLQALQSDIAGVAKASTSSASSLTQQETDLALLKNSSLRVYSNQKGVSKRINDFTKADSLLDTHRFEVDEPSAVASQYVDPLQLADYIKAKLGVTVDTDKTTWDRDMYITGKITATQEVISWFVTAVGSDVLANLTADAPLRKSTSSHLVLDYNTSQFEVVGGAIQIKAGVLAPAAHYHIISDVTGLQAALDGKQAAGSYVLTSDSRLSDSRPASDVSSWAKASIKPSYSYSEIGSRPTLLSQFTNDLGTPWTSMGYLTAITAGALYRPIGYVPAWDEVTSKPTWTTKMGWDGSAVTISSSLKITGQITATEEIIAWMAGAVGSDVLSNLTADAPLRKSTTSHLVLDYNTSQFEVVGGAIQIKAGVLAPAAHYHIISDVTGLQAALDGKQAAGSYVLTSDSRLSDSRPASDVYSWAKAGSKPSYNYNEVGADASGAASGLMFTHNSTYNHVNIANGQTAYNAIYGSTLSGNYLPKWDGTSLVNSNISDTGDGDVHINANILTPRIIPYAVGTDIMISTRLSNIIFNSTTNTEWGRITSDGKFLLGYISDPTPATPNKLAVNGNVYTSGNYKLSDGNGLYWGGTTNGIYGYNSLNGLYFLTNNTLGLSLVNGNVSIPSTTASTSTSTGALVVGGGLGVGGNIYAGGGIIGNTGLTIRQNTVIDRFKLFVGDGTSGIADDNYIKSLNTDLHFMGGGSGTTELLKLTTTGNLTATGAVTAQNFTIKNSLGVTKWTITLGSSDVLEFRNAAGVLEANMDQSGNINAKGELSAYASI